MQLIVFDCDTETWIDISGKNGEEMTNYRKHQDKYPCYRSTDYYGGLDNMNLRVRYDSKSL